MSRMLAAQLYRLRHDKVFWGGLICMVCYSLSVLGNTVNGQIRQGYQVALDQLVFYGYGLDSFIPVAGLVLSAVISFFTGTEYSDGTLRNALIVGRTRAEIYLSHVLVSLITALTYNLAYIVIVIVLGGPVFGGFHLSAAALALGLNILMAFLQLDRFSETFREVSRAQADVPLWLGIVLYGLAAPFSEELVFRGIIYGKARDIFGAPEAMVFSGLIFGIYHGNLVQGIYAAFLGTVLAWTMEHTGTLLAPMIFHGIGNITVFLLINAAGLGGALARPWICAALLFISAVCFRRLLKGGKAG